MSDSPIVYQDGNGIWCYRLSAWGSCIRDLVAARRGFNAMPPAKGPDPWLHEGHLHEDDVVDQLLASGWTVEDRQQRVELDLGLGKIIGHLDAGKLQRVPDEQPWLLEVKALGKTTFSEAESMGVDRWVKQHQVYSWQIAGEMLSTQQRAIVVVKSRDSGKKLIEEIETPPKTYEDFQDRMEEIQRWVDVERFPPCEKAPFCWKGPYRHIHYKDTDPKDPIPIHETRNQAMETLSEKLYDVRQKKKALEQQEADLKDEILQISDEGIYITDRFKVTIREVESKRIDQKAIRLEHGDKYDRTYSYPNVRIDLRD